MTGGVVLAPMTYAEASYRSPGRREAIVGEPRARGILLWVRAALLGSVGVLSGVVSHAAADGLLPSVGWLVALTAASTLVAARWLRRRRSAPALVGLALAAQTGVHLVLSILSGHRGETPAAPVLTPATPSPALSLEDALMGVQVDPAVAPDLGWTGHALDHLTAMGPWMALAHVAGAALLGIWLAAGEAAMWDLLLFVAATVHARLAAPSAPVVRRPPRAAPARGVVVVAAGLLVVEVRSRRGPPVPVC